MARQIKTVSEEETRAPKRPPATTVLARENQLIALTYDMAEEQIRARTASSQVMTHFLKMGTERERLEREKLESENHLAKARVEQMASNARIEELYSDAISAMRKYQGEEDESV